MPSITKSVNAPKIIDFSPFYGNDEEAKKNLIQSVKTACLNDGFLQIVNHNIPRDLQLKVFEASKEFFALPLEKKEKISMKTNNYNRGYELLKSQILEPGTLPELKEGVYFGRDLPLDHPFVIRGMLNSGPNLWPQDVLKPKVFESVITDYYNAVLNLTSQIFEVIAAGLGLKINYFDDLMKEASAILRLLHYPPQPPTAGAMQRGIGKHTDFGIITLLMQDHVGGLQVLDRDTQEWVDVKPIEGAYVVNLGDLMQRWTNDKYISNFHRVINTSGLERFSVPFFLSGNPDYIIKCLPGCEDSNGTSKYPPVAVDEYVKLKYKESYGRSIDQK